MPIARNRIACENTNCSPAVILDPRQTLCNANSTEPSSSQQLSGAWESSKYIRFVGGNVPVTLRDRRLRCPRSPDWTARTGKSQANPGEIAPIPGPVPKPIHNLFRGKRLDLVS
jgi:hypothetical protein